MSNVQIALMPYNYLVVPTIPDCYNSEVVWSLKRNLRKFRIPGTYILLQSFEAVREFFLSKGLPFNFEDQKQLDNSLDDEKICPDNILDSVKETLKFDEEKLHSVKLLAQATWKFAKEKFAFLMLSLKIPPKSFDVITVQSIPNLLAMIPNLLELIPNLLYEVNEDVVKPDQPLVILSQSPHEIPIWTAEKELGLPVVSDIDAMNLPDIIAQIDTCQISGLPMFSLSVLTEAARETIAEPNKPSKTEEPLFEKAKSFLANLRHSNSFKGWLMAGIIAVSGIQVVSSAQKIYTADQQAKQAMEARIIILEQQVNRMNTMKKN